MPKSQLENRRVLWRQVSPDKIMDVSHTQRKLTWLRLWHFWCKNTQHTLYIFLYVRKIIKLIAGVGIYSLFFIHQARNFYDYPFFLFLKNRYWLFGVFMRQILICALLWFAVYKKDTCVYCEIYIFCNIDLTWHYRDKTISK